MPCPLRPGLDLGRHPFGILVDICVRGHRWKPVYSAEVLARFEVEHHALTLMNHPAIARVHDAGATPEGRPYFVMEYVPGIPITDFCDRERLSTRERLGLFVPICSAVQHAHQKGVCHRDLKPSNILVKMQDGKPVPKIIDFGVAVSIVPKGHYELEGVVVSAL